MLAALSPAAANYQETLSTLRFAQQAKSLKTKAIVNEDPIQRLINELRAEIVKLKDQLASGGIPLPGSEPAVGGNGGGGGGGGDDDDDGTKKKKKKGDGGGGSSGDGGEVRIETVVVGLTPEEVAEKIAAKEEEVMARVAMEMKRREEEWGEKERNMLALAVHRDHNNAINGGMGGGFGAGGAQRGTMGFHNRASMEDLTAGGGGGAGSGGGGQGGGSVADQEQRPRVASVQITSLHQATALSPRAAAEAIRTEAARPCVCTCNQNEKKKRDPHNSVFFLLNFTPRPSMC